MYIHVTWKLHGKCLVLGNIESLLCNSHPFKYHKICITISTELVVIVRTVFVYVKAWECITYI